ncbi:MAG: hypothetical protein HRU32_06775, partial [Rhodobacteraceae bacterium]|nr:hypothetical protein [Paracoccaceae bacterium]
VATAFGLDGVGRRACEQVIEDRADRWARVPEGSQRGYGSQPPPGHPVPSPEAVSQAPAIENFAPVQARITGIDTLVLDPTCHRRARFDRADGFAGTWCAP